MATMALYRVTFVDPDNNESRRITTILVAIRPQKMYREYGEMYIAKMVAEFGVTSYALKLVGTVFVDDDAIRDSKHEL